ncbi:hypothetical protein BaRGS_00011255 [Batillaria attramentaria]|uniref:Transposable element P transposase n=1 Tax=Batillaria attramentaria TaxID=370345 RepID=A0ABD0LDV6_9CAEN
MQKFTNTSQQNASAHATALAPTCHNSEKGGFLIMNFLCADETLDDGDRSNAVAPHGSPSSHHEQPQTSEASPCKAALKKNLESKRKSLKRVQGRLYRARKTIARKKLSRNCQKKSGMTAPRKEQVLNDLSHFLPQASCEFIASQLREIEKKKRGRRWSDKDKAIALSLFHASPKAYRILKAIFVLPSVSLLRKTIQKVQVHPGYNDRIFNALQMKISALPESSKLCSVVVDEMTIKEHVSYNEEKDQVEGLEDFGDERTQHVANHATVFILRGLIHNWKQPVGYFLTSGPIDSHKLHSLLLKCIDKAEEAGLKVKLVVADQGSNNRKMFDKCCKITETKPFFFHNGEKILALYDPPHLLKNVRNNLKKSAFMINGKQVSWTYIQQFYHFDQRNSVRMAPKLTDKHITLPPFSTLSVSMAAQVLSHSVAAGIATLAQLGTLPTEANETAAFIDRFDQLFNVFNSGNLTSEKPMGHAMAENSGHKEFLTETLEWLENVQSGRSLPCLTGWKMAIRTLLALWEDLHTNHQVRFLLTDRLNQDCLENLFSQIRGNKGHVDNPSAEQFRLFLRQVMVDNFLVHSTGSNCRDDSDKFLLTLTSLICNSDTVQDETEALDGMNLTDESPSTSSGTTLRVEISSETAASLVLDGDEDEDESEKAAEALLAMLDDSESKTAEETSLALSDCEDESMDLTVPHPADNASQASSTVRDSFDRGEAPAAVSESCLVSSSAAMSNYESHFFTQTVRGPSGHDCKVMAHSQHPPDADLLGLTLLPEPEPKDPTRLLAEKNVLGYIAGYIGRKLFPKLCIGCNDILKAPAPGNETDDLFILNKQYTQTQGAGLFVPSRGFREELQVLEAAYIRHIDGLLYCSGLKDQLTKILKEHLVRGVLVCPSKPSCELEARVIKLFINVRLHATLKDSNQSFSQKGFKRNKKLMKVNYL